MLKLRLTRTGKKKQPIYRIVVMKNLSRRDGRSIDQVGFYNPLTKESYFNVEKVRKWLSVGVQPTETVQNLLKKSRVIE
jgi:small subunit ribosomal protein S16